MNKYMKRRERGIECGRRREEERMGRILHCCNVQIFSSLCNATCKRVARALIFLQVISINVFQSISPFLSFVVFVYLIVFFFFSFPHFVYLFCFFFGAMTVAMYWCMHYLVENCMWYTFMELEQIRYCVFFIVCSHTDTHKNLPGCTVSGQNTLRLVLFFFCYCCRRRCCLVYFILSHVAYIVCIRCKFKR